MSIQYRTAIGRHTSGVQFRVRNCRRAAVVVFTLLIGTALASAPRAEDGANVLETFHVAKNGDFLLVPVTIDGEDFQFLFDTGTTATILDSVFQKKLGAPRDTARVNGKGGHPVFDMPVAHVGNSRFPVGGIAICLDLSRFRCVSGYEIRGVLGMSFLRDCAIRINFDAGELQFLRSAPQSCGVGLQLSYTSTHIPTLNIEIIAGEFLPFMIDTGHQGWGTNCGEIATVAFERLTKSRRLRSFGQNSQRVTFDGFNTSKSGVLDRFQIGEFEHEQLEFGEAGISRVGLAYLSRFIVVLDFPGDRLHLEPSKLFANRPQYTQSDLLLLRARGRTAIGRVSRASRAEAIGLKRGDEILHANGRPSEEFTIFELYELFSRKSGTVQLVVRNGDVMRNVELDLTPRATPLVER